MSEKRPYHPPVLENRTDYVSIRLFRDFDGAVPLPKRFASKEQTILFNWWYSYVLMHNEIPGGVLWHMTYPDQILGFDRPFMPSPNDKPNLTTNPTAMESLIRRKKLPRKDADRESPLVRVEIAMPDRSYLGEARVTAEGFDLNKPYKKRTRGRINTHNFNRCRLDFMTDREIPVENYRRFDLVEPGKEPVLLGTTAVEAYKKLVELVVRGEIEPIEFEQFEAQT